LTAVLPFSLTLSLFAAGIMQRLTAKKLHQAEYEREAKFSLLSSYVCFAAALVLLSAGAFLS